MAGTSREPRRSRVRTNTGISVIGSRARLSSEKGFSDDPIDLDELAGVRTTQRARVMLHGGRTL